MWDYNTILRQVKRKFSQEGNNYSIPEAPQKIMISRSTRFDSDAAQIDAVSRALLRTITRQANGEVTTDDIVGLGGVVRARRDQSVVTGYPGGYGSGVEVMRDAQGKPLPERSVQATGQDPNAFVLLQYNKITGLWEPITQYPTNLPITTDQHMMSSRSNFNNSQFLSIFSTWFNADAIFHDDMEELLSLASVCATQTFIEVPDIPSVITELNQRLEHWTTQAALPFVEVTTTDWTGNIEMEQTLKDIISLIIEVLQTLQEHNS